MRIVALVLLFGLIAGQNGGSVEASLHGSHASPGAHGTGGALSTLRRRTTGDFVREDPSPCLSLRENEDRQLLCNDRRSKFNFNPFGLRFGKRFNSYIKRARTDQPTAPFVFSRDLEVPN
ncbi:kisspeptin 2 [Genypterus blacodes]|uniref:kisspeptin 2 n=1 Tax=Genypterus blacodes TaxID=154954 RepID=UPI003F771CF5